MTNSNSSSSEVSSMGDVNTAGYLLDLIDVNTDKVEKRLESYARISTGCHLWIGPVRVNDSGMPYPRTYISYEGKCRAIAAHRLSIAFHKDIDPTGRLVRHACDNTMCINPDHLDVGSPQENSNDCCVRERRQTRLSTEDVKFIISRLANNTDAELAQFVGYKAHPRTIRDIRNGVSWKHLRRAA